MEAESGANADDTTSETAAMDDCLCNLVDRGSVESHRYFLARRTLMQMLKDRGFSVPISDINTHLHDFRVINSQHPDLLRLRFSVTHLLDPSKRVLVVFCEPGSVNLEAVRNIISQIINKDSLSSLILVLQGSMTSAAENCLGALSFEVEIFQIADLLVNITRHILTAEHQVLTEAEKQNVLEKYGIQESQIPRVSRKDAIVRYYGLKKGQVLKICYVGGITDNYFSYRCVS